MDEKELIEKINKVLEIKEKRVRLISGWYHNDDYERGYNDCLEQVREILEGIKNEY